MLKADYIIAEGASIGKINANTIDVGSLEAKKVWVKDSAGYIKITNAANTETYFNATNTGVSITGEINASSGSITGTLNLGPSGKLTTSYQSYSSNYGTTLQATGIEFNYTDPAHGQANAHSEFHSGSLNISYLYGYTSGYIDDEMNITYNSISRRIKEAPTMIEYTEYPL